MQETILVTGGAGFIGSHLCDALLTRGAAVRVFDNLDPQVHGPLASDGHRPTPPAYLSPEVEFIYGDVRDRDALRRALQGVDVVFHQAAAVGVGQSMYQVHRYIDVNTRGTAVLLDLLITERNRVRKLIVASSMSIYGEGAYTCPNCGPIYPEVRPEAQLAAGDWEMHCQRCGAVAEPRPTSEDKPLKSTSVYAVSKKDQEELCLIVGRAYGIPTVALRYFNVYGPRQALSNPYTGVAAIFSSRLLNGKPPLIFEDGQQTRDFVHVRDIVQANLLALDSEAANYQAINIGTGRRTSVAEIATLLTARLGLDIAPRIVHEFRKGDIRHCYADISKARCLLGYTPSVPFEQGVDDLIAWVRQQTAQDRVEGAYVELATRGLTFSAARAPLSRGDGRGVRG